MIQIMTSKRKTRRTRETIKPRAKAVMGLIYARSLRQRSRSPRNDGRGRIGIFLTGLRLNTAERPMLRAILTQHMIRSSLGKTTAMIRVGNTQEGAMDVSALIQDA